MADEDITLDGKPLQSLRVADLKAALEQRNLSKSGQKNTLIKRLKGALMLENLQKSSSSHSGLQPNSQIGEEMSQNSFIQQYLAKQQELLRQRLEREAQQDDADDSPAVPEEDEDHSEDNESSPYVSEKKRSVRSHSSMTRAEEKGDSVMGHGPPLHPQESLEASGAKMQRATFHQGHKEPPAPSPPRAIASLSVRVLGQPDRQGLPPAIPRTHEKEGAAPSEPGSAHPVLHLSRSAGVSSRGHANEDSDEDDSDDDESEDDEDWGPGPGGARRGKKAPPQPQKMPPSVPSTFARSKRKLQPPQHIPPPQAHHSPMQLRHPTPPPSPPPDLFPLPDTPKQSPPDADDQEGDGPEARGPRVGPFPPPTMQSQDSDSSSRSSSPEPPAKRRPGPLSLLAHKMESEKAFRAAGASSALDLSGEALHSSAGPGSSSKSPLQKSEQKSLQENQDTEEGRQLKEEKEREQRKMAEQEREQKCLEEERERKRLAEEERLRQKEEQEKEQKRLEEEREKEKRRQQEEKEKEKKRQEEEKRREEKLQKEKSKREETAKKLAVTEAQDSDSSSDSDTSSHSSQSSSSSSSSSRDKTLQVKKSGQGVKDDKGAEKHHLSKREVSEPSAAAVTEMEAESESSAAQQPSSGTEPEKNDGRTEESTLPKAFAARKISLTSSKTPPATTDGGAGEAETGSAAGRKRRWGSSTSVTAKKPSISITTDSLKSLIPDIKVKEEAVVDLHPEELQLSGDEESLDASRGDQDKGLKIRRTVTQVVSSDGQENGQTNEEEEMETAGEEKQPCRVAKDKRNNSVCEEASELPPSFSLDGEKVTPSDSVVRRSISQQKSGVSVTIDDPVRTTRQPSPPHGKVSNIIHVTNLVRPFTLGQLKELLNRTGSLVEEGFWIDKIKSHCFVTYATTEEAVATRAALHRVKWPLSNPKVLNVDFCEQDELDFHKGVLKPEKEKEPVAQPAAPQNRLPPLMPERDRERERDRDRDRERDRERERDRGVAGVRDLWAEREREMQRRERARGEREWDRDKVREFARPGEEGRRSRSRDRERKRKERAKSKEKKTDKKEKGDEPPAKLLDDLFLKTKAAPCIYWLPHTEEQAMQRLLDRTERQKERERRHKEQQEEEDKKREEEKKERLKGREKDGSAAASGAGRAADGDRERDRGRNREGDKKRDSGHRARRPSPGAVGGRRSRSRSNPRDKRR